MTEAAGRPVQAATTGSAAFGPGAGIGKPHAPPPDPLPAPAFDSHCHLDMIDLPVAEVLDQARAAGITRVVTVGCDVPSARWAADCAAAFDEVYAAVAIHPNETALAGRGIAAGGDAGRAGRGIAAGGDAGRAGRGIAAGGDAALAEIARLAALPQVRAVGETGLDYYRDSAPPQVQRDWFRAHIDIAKQVRKPLMIHDRAAHEDVLAILAADGAPEQVIFHCFSGDAELAARCAAAGYVLSFAGTVTFQNAADLRAAAAAVPAELILAETDAPFLTPVPNRGKANAPAQVASTVRAIAAVRQLDVAKLCAVIEATGKRLFWGQG